MELQADLGKLGLPQMMLTSSTEVEGYISAMGEEFYIYLKVFDDVHPRKIRFRGSWRLQQLLLPVTDVLQQHLLLCSTIVDMVQEIKNTLEHQLNTTENCKIPPIPSVSYYEILLKQLQDLGWDRVSHINEQLTTIEFKALDDFHRYHYLRIHLPKEFPNEAPTCVCDMPEELCFKWSANKTLINLYDYFHTCLQKFSFFWNMMDEIDLDTWVLDPENPTRKDCKRRIALATNASLLIIVNPISPSSVPVCHYFGHEKVIAPLRGKFNENIDRWDENFSLLSNLQNVLEIDFPSPQTSKKEELCIDCGICSSHKLGEELPDVICNDSGCAQPFHSSCLSEWLRSVPNARTSFNTIFGECPYCNQPIWCTMPAA